MVTTETTVVATFATGAVILWWVSTMLTDDSRVQVGMLVLIGIVLPTLINEWRVTRK
jgi:hypothetical protein